MTSAPEELIFQHRLRWLAWLHLAGVLGTAVLVFLATWRVPGLAAGPLFISLAVFAVLQLGVVAYLYTRPETALSPAQRTSVIYVQLVLDLAAITICLHLSGGAENPFFPFYVFPVLLAAVLLSRPAARGFAAAASLLYAGLLAAEGLGWLSHYQLGTLHEPGLYREPLYAAGMVAAVAATCFLASEAAAGLVGRLMGQAAELAESHRRAETRAAQLHELNERLRNSNLDCRNNQKQLDDLYAELQQAYNRLQVRSQHMSELNEQLRAANAECKARREELATANEQVQDAYRRLETRSEHMKVLNEQLRDANEECRSQREKLTRLNDQLARANEKLSQLDDARAQFTLLVTHELRAPVAAIQSYLKLILEGYVPPAKIQETLEKAEKRAMEQLALIADLLELGRIQSADARGKVEPVQLDRALIEQNDLMAARAQERAITVNVTIGPDLPPVLANMDQMRSVWNNLISNAIKYNSDGGRVEVTLRCENDRLEGAVSDTGIGIPPEAMPRLFSEFFRADNAKAASRMGTGLGLSIVKEIIERAGGRITVESQLGHGTTFRFWLPVLHEGAAAPAS